LYCLKSRDKLARSKSEGGTNKSKKKYTTTNEFEDGDGKPKEIFVRTNKSVTKHGTPSSQKYQTNPLSSTMPSVVSTSSTSSFNSQGM
jgi:hypothetical protein